MKSEEVKVKSEEVKATKWVKFHKITNALLLFAVGVCLAPLAPVIVPLALAVWGWYETDDE